MLQTMRPALASHLRLYSALDSSRTSTLHHKAHGQPAAFSRPREARTESAPTAKTLFAWGIALERFRSLGGDGVDLPLKVRNARSPDPLQGFAVDDPGQGTQAHAVACIAGKGSERHQGASRARTDEGGIDANPAAGLSGARGTNEKSDRLPYTTEEASALDEKARKALKIG